MLQGSEGSCIVQFWGLEGLDLIITLIEIAADEHLRMPELVTFLIWPGKHYGKERQS